METIINKVSQSGLLTIDLEELYDESPRRLLDIKEQLYMGLMLKEKEFRDYIKTNDWESYRGCLVAVTCSTDAIVPTWAYMLIANKLSGIAKFVVFGSLQDLENVLFVKRIDEMDFEMFKDQRIVVKGCSHKPVPVSAYVYLTEKLTPIVKSIMYGEPCSTVPVYKRPS
jgi:hypothetical protein